MNFISRKPLITIVAPIAMRYDAISNAVRSTYECFASQADWEVAVIAGCNEFEDLPVRVLSGVGELLMDQAFRSADALIYHFGIYHPFFDALPIGNGRAKQIVCFHNITPPEFVRSEARPLIEKSFRQLHNLRHAHHIWAISQFNADVLIEHGLHPDRIEVIPLSVEKPALRTLQTKLDGRLQLLFLGRAVQSKGLLDCIEAVSRVQQSGIEFNLSVVGNAAFADPLYLDRCRARVAKPGLNKSVQFVGTADDATLAGLFARAQVLVIPSYHEGFGVTIVESLRSGCIPVGYDAANLPSITNGFGHLVPLGDIDALGAALCQIAKELREARQNSSERCIMLDCGPTSVDEFDQETKCYVRKYTADKVYGMQIAGMKRLLFCEHEVERSALPVPKLLHERPADGS